MNCLINLPCEFISELPYSPYNFIPSTVIVTVFNEEAFRLKLLLVFYVTFMFLAAFIIHVIVFLDCNLYVQHSVELV